MHTNSEVAQDDGGVSCGYCEPSNEVNCGYREVTRNSVGDRVEDRDIKGADETFFHEGREVMVWK